MPMAQRTKLKMLAIKYVAGERSLERSLENAGDFSDLFAASIEYRLFVRRRYALPVPVVSKTGVFRHQFYHRKLLIDSTKSANLLI